jgi:hypothetical protein
MPDALDFDPTAVAAALRRQAGITTPTPAVAKPAPAPATLPKPAGPSAEELAEDAALKDALLAIAATAQPRHPPTDQAVDDWLRRAITARKRWGYTSLQLPFRDGSPLAGLFAGRLVYHVSQEVVEGKRPYRFWLNWGDGPGEYPDLTPPPPSAAELAAAKAEAARLRATREAQRAENRAKRHAAQTPKGPSGQRDSKGKGGKRR